jgi:NAD(P)-dependent dehydrogenase (short-subunit alcohol dehydrogenase family)
MEDLKLSYRGKRVVVTGAASGIGEATARIISKLEGEVIALDVKDVSAPVKDLVRANLADKASIDDAVKKIGGPVHALINCAGLPGPPFTNLETMLVNFIGLRHLSESLAGLMPPGGAIASVASVAGAGYLKNMSNILRFLANKTFDEARAFCEANSEVANGYRFAKEALIVYTMKRAKDLGAKGIRINCISPGVTETPMLPKFHALVTKAWMETHLQGFLGRNSRADEQAWPLVFVCSDLASFMSGTNIFVDAGHTGALMTGEIPPPPPPPMPVQN